MTRTLAFTGAKGGQGTTTVAAAVALLAARNQPTTLVTAQPGDIAAVLGVPRSGIPGRCPVAVAPDLWLATEPPTNSQVTVIDGPEPANGPTEHFAIVRGPCYLALARLLADARPMPDGIVLLVEPGRSLSERDVVEVTGIPVVAAVPVTDAVARAVDAGLLMTRLAHLDDLRPLRTLVETPPTAHRRTATMHRTRQRQETRSPTGTDLPRSASGPRRCGGTRVKRVANGTGGCTYSDVTRARGPRSC